MDSDRNKLIAPKKQSFPIILWFALCYWGSSSLFYTLSSNILDNGSLSLSSISNAITNARYIVNNHADFLYCLIIFALILVSILVLFMIKSKSYNFIKIVLIAVLIGLSMGLVSGKTLQVQQSNIYKEKFNMSIIEVEDDQKEGMYTNSSNANIKSNSGNTYKVKVQFDKNIDEVHAGDLLQANIKLNSPSDSQKDNFWQNGIAANAKLENIKKLERKDFFGIVYGFRNTLINLIRTADDNKKSEEEQLLSAIICGQRIDLNTGALYDSFKNAGLAHIVAVSGAHLSLVTAILLICLKKLKLSKHIIICIQSLFILMYLICAAIPISALRAAIMTYIAIFSFFGKRRPASLNALGVCIIAIITINPQASVSVSFALSAGSTLGIILFSSLFTYFINLLSKKIYKFINSALSLTFSANICSQPLSVSIFNQLSLIAPVSNVVCTPIFTLLCGYGLVSCVIATIVNGLFPAIGKLLIKGALAISKGLCIIVKFLASLPFASIPAEINIFFAISISIFISFILYKLWPKQQKEKQEFVGNIFEVKINKEHTKSPLFDDKKVNLYTLQKKKKPYKKRIIVATLSIAILTIFLAIFILIPKVSQTELIALDVGQGDSILLKSKGYNFLIDTGNQDNLLKSRLAEQHITHLNGVLITHPDDDHCGSLDVIESLVQVDNIYVANDLANNKEENCKKLMQNIQKIVSEDKIIKLNVGHKICFGEYELDVVWPDKYTDNGGNCDSVCVLAKIDVNNDSKIDSTAFLCGDAEKDEVEKMQHSGRLPNVDIYKCGHHGSKNALTEQSTRMLNPKITLISVGAKNRYGHPAKNTINILETCGSKIYRTDQNGSITIKFSVGKIDIITTK